MGRENTKSLQQRNHEYFHFHRKDYDSAKNVKNPAIEELLSELTE